MRAVAFDAFGAPPRLAGLPDPAPPPHGAVVRVEATGLCRSDWHGWKGHDPDITAFPHVPGHELAGVVEAVGPEVRGDWVGRRVTTPFVCACGTCAMCARGDGQVCERQTQPGFTHWGSFAELVAVHHADVNLVALPDGLPSGAAAALGCRMATAFRAVVHVGRVAPGERVAVHGCGGVGLSAVQVAVAAGARVLGIDPDPAARELARSLGAEAVAAPGVDVRALTGGGADLSIEAIGAEEAVAASIDGLRRRGRHVQVGLLPTPVRVPMARVIAHELELLGAHGMPAHAYPQLLAAVLAGRIDPAALVTRTLPLADAPAALAGLGAPGTPAGVTLVDPRR